MKKTDNPTNITQRNDLTEVECNNCGLYSLCRLAGLEANETTLNSIVERRQNIASADYLYHAGEDFKSLYAVKSGTFKSISYFEDGRELVTDFHLPGELIGLEAIEEGVHLQSVVALENSSICDMNFAKMQKLDNKFTAFQNSVIQALSRKVRLNQQLSLLTGAQSAEQRLAIFLINIFSRLQANEMQTQSFKIPKRKDIASYLGLAEETVCRILKHFEKSQLIETKGRKTHLCNHSEIQKIAGVAQHSSITRVA